MSDTEDEPCPDCEGSGEEELFDGDMVPCSTCDGEGKWCAYCCEPGSKCVCDESVGDCEWDDE